MNIIELAKQVGISDAEAVALSLFAKAIRAEALSEPVNQEPVGMVKSSEEWGVAGVLIAGLPIGTKLYAAPLQPVKQEPVAWILPEDLEVLLALKEKCGEISVYGYQRSKFATNPKDAAVPLYAAPVDAKAIRAEADIKLQREIMRLQAIIDEQRNGAESIKKNLDFVRAEALEEAAKVCDEPSYTQQRAKTSAECAAAIRSLK